MLSHDEVLGEFRAAGALLEGHFILSSGLAQFALPAMRPGADGSQAGGPALPVPGDSESRDEIRAQIDLVASPAMGGVVVGYEMGRQLGVPAIFFERVEGKLVLRRGFTIAKGARVLMVEDIVTTGLSSRECIAGIAEEGGVTLAAACLIDRSGGKADLGVPLFALTSLEIPAYPADALPPELAAIPAIKPGSRGLNK